MRSTTLWFVRTLLGIILFWQGFGKVFTWGLDNVYNNAFLPFEETFLPIWILKGTLYFTSFGELITGLLLVLGLFRKWAYMIIIMILLIVSFGHGLKDPIWDLQHVVFRVALLFPLILLPLYEDKYSIDQKWMS